MAAGAAAGGGASAPAGRSVDADFESGPAPDEAAPAGPEISDEDIPF